ncbi:hypothetical protein FA13DRAFT_1807508 [Coprinellus micaceus]|uniref:CHAT domain-containing protein n=1 Tax=Coprinellus micaceus TaxID=71717 RepID=A0A4Y7R803_COPMI|nr:hypothetical protein FA13DRAFT_1807508 [Coprinellus micaceus]
MNGRNLRVLSDFPVETIKTIVRCIVELQGQDVKQLDLIAQVYRYRFESDGGDGVYLEEAVRAQQESVNRTEAGDPKRRRRLDALAEDYYTLYVRTEAAELPAPLPGLELGELEPTIADLDEFKDQDVKVPNTSGAIGLTVAAVFYHKGVNMGFEGQDATSVTRGLSLMGLALSIAPPPDCHQPAWLANLVCRLHTELLWTGEATSLALLKTLWGISNMNPPDWRRTNPDIPLWMLNTVFQHQGLYQLTQRFEDLVDGLNMARRAISICPLGHPFIPIILGRLGAWHIELFHCGDVSYKGERGGSQHNLLSAIRLLGIAIELSEESERAALLDELAKAQMLCKLVDEAIQSWEQALEYGPLPSEISQYNLGITYGKRFTQNGDLQDIERMVQTLRHLVESTLSGQDCAPHFTLRLGSALLERYDVTSELSDLDEAIQYLHLAQRNAGMTPLSRGEIPHFLSKALISRHERTGDRRNVEEAILILRQAIQMTPPSDSQHTIWLRYLMYCLRGQYFYTRDLQDLREAISVGRRAAADVDHPRFHDTLLLLGSTLRILHQGSKDREDIEEAIAVLEWAIGSLPSSTSDSSRQWAMHELGLSYAARSRGSNDPIASIDAGLSILESVSSSGPMNDGGDESRQVQLLKDRAHLRMERFKFSDDRADIVGAVENFRKVVAHTPDAHAGLTTTLYGLGMALKLQYEKTEDINDLTDALECMRRATLTDAVGDTQIRFAAAKEWTSIALRLQGETPKGQSTVASTRPSDRWLDDEEDTQYVQEALRGMEAGMRLIPLLAGPAQPTGRRPQAIKANAIDAFTLLASSYAVWLGRAAMGVEWLEQGRCLLWNQLNILRSPLDDLCALHPVLAARFIDVSRSLEKAGIDSDSTAKLESFENRVSLQTEAKRHADLAQEWEELVQTIHSLPGFEDFLGPSPYSQLHSSIPSGGFVVLLNFHDSIVPLPQHSMSNAVILSRDADQPMVVRFRHDLYTIMQSLLPALQNELVAQEFLPEFLRGEQDLPDPDFNPSRALGRFHAVSGRTKSQGISKLLEFLWHSICQPVVQAIGLEPSDSPTARIWWCLTGPLPFIPVHAAGVHHDGGRHTLAHHAISSYIPTITSLGKLSNRPWNGTKAVEGCLTVSVPNAPGQIYLPGVTEEARLIEGLMHDQGTRHLTLESNIASKAMTVQNMEHFSCIHLACHATQNPEDPLRSRFFLQDGTLDLSTIIKANLPSADLAFLSACQTSRGDEKFTEEVLHLAAGMLAAGYRSVVATMWSIRDTHAPGLAESFYAYLLRKSADNGRVIDGSLAAFALHHAARELMEKLDDSNESFMSWVPYVHWGV